MTDIERKIAIVHGEHKHDCATFDVESADGRFTIQYADTAIEGFVWNVAANPPGRPPDDYAIIDQGSNFYLLASNAQTVEDAYHELGHLLNEFGDEYAEVTHTSTFRMMKSPAGVVADWLDEFQRWFGEVFARRTNGGGDA